jgi:hypothetical protein
MDRTFTLKEATELLPVLESLLRSAMEGNKRLQQSQEELQELRQRIFLSGGTLLSPSHLWGLRRRGEEASRRVKDALAEIDAMGVQVKDLETGLLDFPFQMGNETVLLCWKLGEPAISFWHTIDDGFAGRRPIDARINSTRQKPS